MKALLLLWLVGCPGAGDDTGPTLDTGWFAEPVDPECTANIVTTQPAAGEDDWYWRSPPLLTVGDPDASYEARLVDAEGREHPVTSEQSGAQIRLALDDVLAPSSDYTLLLRDCRGPREVGFRTSALGEPLAVDVGELTGRTYAFDIGDARWEEPPGIGALMNLYFSDPILIGVEWSSSSVVDLLGGQGYVDTDGATRQYLPQPTWDFPVADFDEQPFFSAGAASITIEFDDVQLIIYDFGLAATFSADGETLGGGWVSGLGDTRYLGPVLNQGNDPNAACDITAGFGASCVPCPDGEPYCLPMSARDARGRWIEGLRMQRRDP